MISNTERQRDADWFRDDHRAEIERIMEWINGFVRTGDLAGALNAGALLYGFVLSIGHYFVARMQQEEERGPIQ